MCLCFFFAQKFISLDYRKTFFFVVPFLLVKKKTVLSHTAGTNTIIIIKEARITHGISTILTIRFYIPIVHQKSTVIRVTLGTVNARIFPFSCFSISIPEKLNPYIKIFFKVGYKIAKIGRPNFFFDPPKNKKPSVQKVPPYEIYGDI